MEERIDALGLIGSVGASTFLAKPKIPRQFLRQSQCSWTFRGFGWSVTTEMLFSVIKPMGMQCTLLKGVKQLARNKVKSLGLCFASRKLFLDQLALFYVSEEQLDGVVTDCYTGEARAKLNGIVAQQGVLIEMRIGVP